MLQTGLKALSACSFYMKRWKLKQPLSSCGALHLLGVCLMHTLAKMGQKYHLVRWLLVSGSTRKSIHLGTHNDASPSRCRRVGVVVPCTLA
eukprot:6183915-Amphidinium_carterae.1